VVPIPDEIEVTDFHQGYRRQRFPLFVQGMDSGPAVAVSAFQGKEFSVEVAESILGSNNLGNGNGFDAPIGGFTGSDDLPPGSQRKETVAMVPEPAQNLFPQRFVVQAIEGSDALVEVHGVHPFSVDH